MEDPHEEIAVVRAVDRVHAQGCPRVHGRVHVAEAPLVSRQLPVRVHEPLTAEKQQLVLGGRRVEMRERDTVEAQIPCRVPRVFPLVGHDEDVVAVEMPPGGVPSAPACRGRSRLRGIAVEPALDVVVVELLAPHEAGEAATHDRRLLVRGAVGAERSVEGLGLSLAVDQHPLETRTQIGERLRRLRACEPQPELHGFPGGHRDAIPARHLRAGLAGIHRRRAVHHVVVDAILRIRRARRRSEEAREVRLVLAEEQGRLCPIGRRAGTQDPCTADGVLRDCDGGGRGDRADHGSIGSPVPGPPIAKPQGREDVQHRLLRARVADLQPDADVVRSCLGVVGGDRPVAVRKDAGFLKLELAVGARPAPVLRYQRGVREGLVRVMIPPAEPGRRRRRVDVPPVFLRVLAVVPFRAREPEYALFQDGIAPVPEREREAKALLRVAHPGEAVFAPPVCARARVVVREILPRASVRAVVFADGTPGALAHVGPERPPPAGLVRRPLGDARPLRIRCRTSDGRCDGRVEERRD